MLILARTVCKNHDVGDPRADPGRTGPAPYEGSVVPGGIKGGNKQATIRGRDLTRPGPLARRIFEPWGVVEAGGSRGEAGV